MKEYKIKYSSDIVADLNKLSDFVAKQYTFDSAKLYIARLRKEIEELSVFAEILSDSKYKSILKPRLCLLAIESLLLFFILMGILLSWTKYCRQV
jgi:hypothetical protein